MLDNILRIIISVVFQVAGAILPQPKEITKEADNLSRY